MPDIILAFFGSVRDKIEAAMYSRNQLREAEDHYAVTGSVASAVTLAGQYLQFDRFFEAKTLFQCSAFGCYRDHPRLLLGLARAHFGLQEYQAALNCLDRLKLKWPGNTSVHDHSLYARCQQELNRLPETAY